MSDQQQLPQPQQPKGAGRGARALTAGLSAVGATAGAGGLAYAAHDALRARRLGQKMPLKTKALIPLEVAGLGGEVMATHILHGDTKRPQTVAKGRDMEFNGSSRTGRRIVEPSKTAANREAREALSPEDLIAKAGLGPEANRRLEASEPANFGTWKARQTRAAKTESWASVPANDLTGRAIQTHSAALRLQRDAKKTGRLVRVARRAVGKADTKRKGDRASAGRIATGALFPGFHGAAAGRKNHKLRAAGYELGGGMIGGALVPAIGAPIGAGIGTSMAHDAGHYKPQKRKVAKSGAGVLRQMQALQRSSGKGRLALKETQALQRKAQGAKTHADMVALQQKVGKARRFDAEADRQRRIGYIGGAATGGAIVTGEVVRRNSRGGLKMVSEQMANGKRRPAGIAHLRMNRRGLIAAGATAALGGLAAGTFKHGVSERNKTWT